MIYELTAFVRPALMMLEKCSSIYLLTFLYLLALYKLRLRLWVDVLINWLTPLSEILLSRFFIVKKYFYNPFVDCNDSAFSSEGCGFNSCTDAGCNIININIYLNVKFICYKCFKTLYIIIYITGSKLKHFEKVMIP